MKTEMEILLRTWNGELFWKLASKSENFLDRTYRHQVFCCLYQVKYGFIMFYVISPAWNEDLYGIYHIYIYVRIQCSIPQNPLVQCRGHKRRRCRFQLTSSTTHEASAVLKLTQQVVEASECAKVCTWSCGWMEASAQGAWIDWSKDKWASALSLSGHGAKQSFNTNEQNSLGRLVFDIGVVPIFIDSLIDWLIDLLIHWLID